MGGGSMRLLEMTSSIPSATPLRSCVSLMVDPKLRAALSTPWQRSREDGDLVLGDLREVAKPGLTINAVALECLDEREHDSGAATNG
jgi:hypothetical protein